MEQVESASFQQNTRKTLSPQIQNDCVLYAEHGAGKDIFLALLGRRWSEGSKDLYGGRNDSGLWQAVCRDEVS